MPVLRSSTKVKEGLVAVPDAKTPEVIVCVPPVILVNKPTLPVTVTPETVWPLITSPEMVPVVVMLPVKVGF